MADSSWQAPLQRRRSGDCLRSAPYNRRDAALRRAGERRRDRRQEPGAVARSPGPLGSVARRGGADARRRRPRLRPQRRLGRRCCSASRSGTTLGADATTAVHDMVVRGDSASGELEFSAWEQRVGMLAVITDAAALEHALDTALGFAPHVTRVDADVAATLVAHCEGRGAASLHVARRRLRAQRLRPAGDRRAAGRDAAASPRRAPVVPLARRPGAAAVRPSRGGALVCAGLVAAGRARRCAAGDGAGGVRGRARRGRRRRGRRAAPRLGARRLAARRRRRGDLVRAGLGAGRRRRPRRSPPRRAGSQPRPRRRRRARGSRRRARAVARRRRRTVAAALRTAARRADLGHDAHYRRFAALVRRARRHRSANSATMECPSSIASPRSSAGSPPGRSIPERPP